MPHLNLILEELHSWTTSESGLVCLKARIHDLSTHSIRLGKHQMSLCIRGLLHRVFVANCFFRQFQPLVFEFSPNLLGSE
jgi:transposase